MISKSEITAKYNRLLELQEEIGDTHSDYQEFMEAILNAGPGPCPYDYNKAKKEYGELIAELIVELSNENILKGHEVPGLLDDIKESRDRFVSQIEDMERLPDPDSIIFDMQPTDCFELKDLPDDLRALNSDKINWPFDFSTAIARNLIASLITRKDVDSNHEFDLMPPNFLRAVVSHVHEGEAQEHPTNNELNIKNVTLKVVITCENTTQTTEKTSPSSSTTLSKEEDGPTSSTPT